MRKKRSAKYALSGFAAALVASLSCQPSSALASALITAGQVSQDPKGYTAPNIRSTNSFPELGLLRRGGVPAQPAPGRPTTRLYWNTPDEIRIFKIRGNDLEGGGLRQDQDGKSKGRSILPLVTWNQKQWSNTNYDAAGIISAPNTPDLDGWSSIPYPQKYFTEGAATVLGDSLNGSLTDRPYDVGLTRYEMWVKKSYQASRRPDSWFFHSYNVVTQSGDVLGTLDITTADSLMTNSRAFRDSPYLVNAVENSRVLRSFSAAPTGGRPGNASILTNQVGLVAQPKMLVLTSPDYKVPNLGTEYKEGSADVVRKTDTTRVVPRTYSETEIKGGTAPFSANDARVKLAPNDSIHDQGPSVEISPRDSALAKYWQLNDDNTWKFKRWQRGETLPGVASHRWVLETKEDLLFAPQQVSQGPIDPRKFEIIGDTNSVVQVPNMVVSSGQVTSLDTGGFRLAWNKYEAEYPGMENIPEDAAFSILPVGSFYPDCRVIVALEYRLLDPSGNEEGDWQTGKIHYWSSEGKGDAFTPRQITFQASGSTFDPYVDGWIFPVKDVSHTSASYRMRVLVALPVNPGSESLISAGGLSSFSGAAANEQRAASYTGAAFSKDQLSAILWRNSEYPTDLQGKPQDPVAAIATALNNSSPQYRDALSLVSLNNTGIYKSALSTRVVGESEVRGVITDLDAVALRPNPDLADTDSVLRPFRAANGDNMTTWYEFQFPNNGWKVSVPTVKVGDEAGKGADSGVIITE